MSDATDTTGRDSLPPNGRPEEVRVVISDLHMGEGSKVTVEYDGKRGASRVWRAIDGWLSRRPKDEEIDNPLEDFHYDDEFAALLEALDERYGDVPVCLVLLGDTFDPLHVTWRGRYSDPPYEAVGAAKMRKIIAAHPKFFAALRRFLTASPDRSIELYVGNHDQFLCWPEVQRLFLEAVTGGEAGYREAGLTGRIFIVDHEEGFERLHRGVLYTHGMNAEAHNAIDPENAIVDEVLGQKLKYPILNMPLGSYMVTDLVAKLKSRNPLVGRVHGDRRVWAHAFRHRWSWGLYSGIMLLWALIYANFFAFIDVRRKASLRRMLGTVRATWEKNPVDRFFKRLLRKRADALAVIGGHSHNFCRLSTEDGTYVNTGSWARAYRLVEYEFERTWTRFQRLEFYWRALQHFFRTGENRFGTRLAAFIGVLALISAMVAFLIGGFEQGISDSFWATALSNLKVPVGILLTFVVVGAIFRLFSVPPDIVENTRFTFALVRHFPDGGLKVDLMEWLPEEDAMIECV
ncbi:hypothetical protein ACFL26_01560 [Patescibacteria group bacterium]